MGGRYVAIAVRLTRYGAAPKTLMKNTGTVRETVTCSLVVAPGTGAGVTTTEPFESPLRKPFFAASSMARSVASFLDPAGLAADGSNWYGMKITPERAAAAAARSAAVL